MKSLYHYCTFLSLNFVRAFTGRTLIEDINTTPEDIAEFKIVSGYIYDGGHVMSFKFKDKLYTMKIEVFNPKEIKVDKPLMYSDFEKLWK
jgi:hypothetical protein